MAVETIVSTWLEYYRLPINAAKSRELFAVNDNWIFSYLLRFTRQTATPAIDTKLGTWRQDLMMETFYIHISARYIWFVPTTISTAGSFITNHVTHKSQTT